MTEKEYTVIDNAITDFCTYCPDSNEGMGCENCKIRQFMDSLSVGKNK